MWESIVSHWLQNSSDLIPIEHVWNMLQTSLNSLTLQPYSPNRIHLWTASECDWIDNIHNDTMLHHVTAVIQAEEFLIIR